jgi:hypothetical protein
MGPPEVRMTFSDRAALERELEQNLRHGRAFLTEPQAMDVPVLSECVLVLVHPVHAQELRIAAQVVMVNPSGPMCGIGIALRSFSAEECQRMQEFAKSEAKPAQVAEPRLELGEAISGDDEPADEHPATAPGPAIDQLIAESSADTPSQPDQLMEDRAGTRVRPFDTLIEESPAADARPLDALIEESPASDVQSIDTLIEESPAATLSQSEQLIEESPALEIAIESSALPLPAAEPPSPAADAPSTVSCDDEAALASSDACLDAFLANEDDGDFSVSEEEELRLDDADADVDASAPVELQSSNKQEKLRKLNAAQQLKVARTGELADRIAVERLYGKQVWDALLHNPRLSIPEVARIARKGTVPKPQLELILENGAWIKADAVRRALLANPKIGAEAVLKLLRITPKHELKLIEKGTAYAPPVRDAARKLLKQ